MTISAILWDFGGVFTSSPFEAFNRLEAEYGAPADTIRKVNSINPETNAWAQFEANSINLDEFDQLFAAETRTYGYEIPGKAVIGVLSGQLRPRMRKVLEACRSHYKNACITNNVKAGEGPGMSRSQDKATRIAELMSLFDLVVESSVEGVRKPDPKIYTLTCERLGVDPNEAVFLDDLGINLKPARALGMQTIKVVSEEQAIQDLSQITGLTFPA